MKEKFKELTKDTAIYGISTILSRFLNFILVPFYTQVFQPAEYGIVTNVYAYIAFLNIVYLYGMDSAYLKYASIKDEHNNKEKFSSPFLFVILTSIFISILFFIFRQSFNQLTEIPIEKSAISNYTIFILLFDALSVIPFAYLRLIRKAKRFAFFKTLNIGLNVVLNLILILVYKMGIEAVFISNLAASILSFILLIPDITRNFVIKIDKNILSKMISFGIPYLPAGLASMIIQVIDRPVLLALTNESTVGVYQANHKLGVFMMLFVSMFQYAWQPFFLHNANEKNAKEIFARVLTYFVLAGSFILVILSLFINDLVTLEIYHGRTIIDKAYLGGLYVVPIVLLAYLFNGIYINLTAGIFIEEKTKYIPLITGLGAAANVVVNFLLIPKLGMMGCAIALLISYLIMSLGLFIVVRKFYKIDYEYKKLLGIFFALTISAVIYYFLMEPVVYNKIIILFGFTLLLFILKIVRKEEFLTLSRLFLK